MKMLAVNSYSGQDRRNQQDFRLTKYYWQLLALISLPVFIVVVMLAVSQYRDQHAQVLHDLAKDNAAFTIALENIAKLAEDHVSQMREWHESYLVNPHEHPSNLSTHFTERVRKGVAQGYTLDNIPESQMSVTGQVPWYVENSDQLEQKNRVLDQAFEFFALVRLTHNVTSYFQWSYFFSSQGDFTYIYPWISSNDLIEGSGYASIQEMIASWLTYEIYTKGTPTRNPQHGSYWTDPYMDAGGTGAMVSHGAPVYVNNVFNGIVGTDVRLETLEQFLMSLPRKVGRLLILDNKNMLLADSLGSPKNVIRSANEVLHKHINAHDIKRAKLNNANSLVFDDYSMVAHTTEHAPWTLVYLVNDDEIANLLLPRFLPYGVIMVVLAITFLLAMYLLRREFIRPAISLVHYIQNISRKPNTAEPILPHLWQPWVNVVTRTFAANREASNKLYESEARLQQILNNSTTVVCVRNLDEQFLLVNERFEQLFNIKQHEIVGKTLKEIFPGPDLEYMREKDLRVIQQNKAMEFEENLELEDGTHTYISIKFPLHDTSGEIYAICTLSTDITQRKHTEEVVRQTALGISEAKGEEMFGSLVTHLARALGVDFALIGLLESHDQIHTKALYANGQITDNIIYPLADSPCENVVGQQFRFYPDNIQQRFPKDTLLMEIGMQSYAAIPLFDGRNGVIGLLAILHSKPLDDEALVESILQIFSGRVASELERERADVALRASEASYRTIFEASPDAIFIHDLDNGEILDVNPTACEVYGYACEEMRKIDVGTLSSGIAPYTQEDFTRLIGRAVAGEVMRFEWHRKNKDGSLQRDEVLLRRASIDGTDCIVAFTREITERKMAEEQLRASEEQYRSIFNASTDTLILWDADGKIVDNNRVSWMLGGYTQEEFTAIPLEQHIHSSSQDALNEFKAALTNGREFTTEGKAIRKDGLLMDLEVRGMPVSYQGKPHILTIIRDITAQKRAREELARQRNALHQNEKLSAMGALVANVAHELNNPLAILMGRAALLENKLKNDPSVEEAHKIRVAAERCGRIVSTFLNMARQRPSEHQPANLNEVVSNALDLLEYGLKTTDISIRKRLAPLMPEQQMDADQIGQVIINLLVNAQHALTECNHTRIIEIETGVAGDHSYVLVIDNGQGVNKEIKERIFDPFFTTKPEGAGTGVGLAVSRAIMRTHQGDLCMQQSSKGAIFKLWLPINKDSPHSGKAKVGLSTTEISYEGTALVVDDEPEIVLLVRDILKSAGFSVFTAATGQEAVAWLEKNHCDFILSDIRMPDLDGPGLLHLLKQKHPELAKRIAFITGDTLSASIAPFLKDTGLPWLRKPFTPEEILELVVQIEAA